MESDVKGCFSTGRSILDYYFKLTLLSLAKIRLWMWWLPEKEVTTSSYWDMVLSKPAHPLYADSDPKISGNLDHKAK